MHWGTRLLQMKSELVSRNTQQDKTTTLNHTDEEGTRVATDGAQDVSSEEQDARGSAFKLGNDNKPHGEGTNTFTRGSRGNREAMEGQPPAKSQ